MTLFSKWVTQFLIPPPPFLFSLTFIHPIHDGAWEPEWFMLLVDL